jgi:adenylate cyclase
MKKLPHEFEDLGEQKVKNIAQPVRAFRLILDARMLEQETESSEVLVPNSDSDLPPLADSAEIASASDPRAIEIEFWDSIKNSTLASEYEAYLDQYPEGSFAALARVRLQAISEDAAVMRDPKDREIELAFWESVRSSDNGTLIQAYLEKYPEGEFSALARIRIEELKDKRREQ